MWPGDEANVLPAVLSSGGTVAGMAVVAMLHCGVFISGVVVVSFTSGGAIVIFSGGAIVSFTGGGVYWTEGRVIEDQ